MEFHSRKACIDYYSDQFPHLPKFMIEMAMDYDLEQSNKKMTGSERRKLKRAEPVKREKCLESYVPGVCYGSATVIPKEEFVMAPMIEGAIEVDGKLHNVDDLSENKISIDTNGVSQ